MEIKCKIIQSSRSLIAIAGFDDSLESLHFFLSLSLAVFWVDLRFEQAELEDQYQVHRVGHLGWKEPGGGA
jgi:hypothetical protein